MKTKKILKVILAFVAIINFSCKDDFTDFDNVGGVNPDNIGEPQALSFLVSIYDKMQFAYGMDWHSAFLVKTLPGDDANAGGGSSADQGQLQDIDSFTLTAENSSVDNVYKNFYSIIGQANFMESVLSEADFEKKDVFIAEARFFRAWSYMELVTMFGSVPLITSPILSPDEFANPRAPLADIYSRIEEDLGFAAEALPSKSELDHSFRVSKGAAIGLLGKALVFQEKYSDAATELAKVISDTEYDLEADFATVWTLAGDYGVESLLEVPYSSEFGYNWGGGLDVAWVGRQESNLHVQLMGPRGSENDGPGFVLPEGNSLGVIAGWGFNLPNTKLISAFEAEGDNARKLNTIATAAEIEAAGGSIISPDGIWDYDGAIRLKYAPRPEESSSTDTQALNYGTNFKVFRYAEVLLLAAEAYNKSGNDAQALVELNKIRTRAGAAELTGLSGDALFDAIVNEKFLEMAHEGQRFWDLVRWGLASTELADYGFQSGKHELFPIPVNEINTNDAITTADQNPGY